MRTPRSCGTTTPAARRRGRPALRSAGALALLLLTVSLAACDPAESEPFDLNTHCGIDEVYFEGEWYDRAGGPLDDGSGNPPEGWDNPLQQGTITRIDEGTLVFTDAAEHREEFVLREGATSAKQGCD